MENDIVRRWTIAKAIAKAILRRDELADEIASDVVVKILEGKPIENRRQIKLATIDAIRTRFGRPGTRRHQSGRIELSRSDVDLEAQAASPSDEFDIVSARLEFKKLRPKLTTRQREFCLFVMAGGTYEEYAKLRKMSMGNLFQIMREVKRKADKFRSK